MRYTRVGRFQLDADGMLVTSHGYPVLAGGGTVTLDPDDGPVHVAEDGSISTDRAQDGQLLQVVGKLDVVDFANRAALKPGAGQSVYDAGTQPPTEATGKVAQRMLEDFERQHDHGDDHHDRGDAQLPDHAALPGQRA